MKFMKTLLHFNRLIAKRIRLLKKEMKIQIFLHRNETGQYFNT